MLTVESYVILSYFLGTFHRFFQKRCFKEHFICLFKHNTHMYIIEATYLLISKLVV